MEIKTLFEETGLAFKTLQAQSTKKIRFYPLNLREQALKLLAHYPAQTLSEALGVTKKTLQNWQQAKNPVQGSAAASFLPLQWPEAQPLIMTNSTLLLRVKLSHDIELLLPEQPLPQIVQFIHALVKEFAPCSI